jgi:hypothetical protein
MLAEPLAICRIEDSRDSVGRVPDWRFSLEWARGMRDYLSPRAYSWFIAVQCVWRAVKSGATLSEKRMLLRLFLFEGRPTWRAAIHFAFFACIPAALRKSMRNRIWTIRGAPGRTCVKTVELQNSTT